MAAASLRNLGRVLRNRASNTVDCRPVLERLSGRGRSRADVAKSIRTIFEALETRQMLSVLPAPEVSNWTELTGPSTTSNPTYNTTPSIAYDPADPDRMVMVYQVNRTNANSLPDSTGTQLVYVEGKYTVDGGKTWLTFDARPDGSSNAGNTIPLNVEDWYASVAAQRLIRYTEATYPTVSFDREHNFYISYTQHRSDNSHGVVILQSFDLSSDTDGPQITSQNANIGGQPDSASATQLGTGKILHQWYNGIDEAYWPTVAADSNMTQAEIDATFSGPVALEMASQGDPHSGDVYVAWIADWTTPQSPFAVSNFNPNGVMLASSQDGGENFTNPTFVNVGAGGAGYVGADRNITPRIVIAQGTVNGTTVVPGTVTVVWADVNSGRNQNPPVDIIRANSISGGVSNSFSYDPTVTSFEQLFVGQSFTTASFPKWSAGTQPTQVLSGNFDGDSRADIVSLNAGDGSITVHRNNGSNVFVEPGVTISGLTNPRAMASADFDGDKQADLLVVDATGVWFLQGTGDTTYFAAPTLVLAATELTSITVGNFDEDKASLPDFAVTMRSGIPGVEGAVLVAINAGGASFPSGFIMSSGGEEPTSIVTADMNGDKHLDLVVGNGGSDNVAVMLGVGDGTFDPTVYKANVGPGPRQVDVLDVDGDKQTDVVVLTDNGIEIVRNTSVADFELTTNTAPAIRQLSSQQFSRFALGEVTGDSKTDILITDVLNDGIVVGRGLGTTAGFSLFYTAGQEIKVGTGPTGIFITPSATDFNGDSKSDVVIALEGEDKVTTLLQVTPGGGPRTTDITMSVGSGTLSGRIRDFDVNLAITHPDVGELSLRLVPPTAALNKINAYLASLPTPTSFSSWQLLRNHLQDVGITFNNRGATGQDFGYVRSGTARDRVGVTFDDDAPRLIQDPGASPYTSAFAPEGGRFSFDQVLAYWSAAGLTAADFEGTWHLLVTDHVVASASTQPQYLDGWGISFTMDNLPSAAVGTPTQVATTTVLSALSGTNALKPGVANTLGIGAGLSVAIDNTLGAYSPNQGRVYVVYTNRSTATGNQTDNTDIQMVSGIGGRNFGAPVLVNDDNALTDGYSEAVVSGNLTSRGRAQFSPSVAVDQHTGTVVVTYSDARQDAARVRFATSLQTSIDGGRTFSQSVFLNKPNQVVDATTGKPVTVGPTPDNGTFNDDPRFGMGFRQDVVAVGGHVYAVWTGNLNGGAANVNRLPDILTADVNIAAGPRVVASTMGPVSQPGDLLNAPLPDGTPILRSFVLTFDRDIDWSTIFTSGIAQNVFLYYRKPGVSGNVGDNALVDPAELISLDAAVPFNADTGVDIDPTKLGGPDKVMVRSVRIPLLDPENDGTRTGTYSYYVAPTVSDRIRKPVALANDAYLTRDYVSDPANSNLVVPNTGTGGSSTPADNDTTSTIKVAGMPTASNVEVISGLAVTINLLHTNVNNLTLTLKAPNGASYVLAQGTSLAGGRNFIRTIFRNDGILDITDTTTFTAPYTTAIDATTGRPTVHYDPATHAIDGTNAFAPVGDLNDLVAKLNDPITGISRNGDWQLVVTDDQGNDTGTLLNWTLTFDTAATSNINGNAMDQNADGTAGTSAWSATTIGDVYAAPNPTSETAWDAASHTFHTPYQSNSLPIIVSGATTTNTHKYDSPAGQNNKSIFDPASPATLPTTESTITIGGDTNAKITDLTVTVNLKHGSADTLKVELIASDGTVILLHRPEIIYRTPGTSGVRAPIPDMQGLVFDDSATTYIGSILSATTTNASGTPFSGRFKPEAANVAGQGLSLLDGKTLAGVWTLRVTDTQPDGIGDSIAVPTNIAELQNWSITATTETVVVNPAQTDPTTPPSVNSVVVTFDHDMNPADMTVPSLLPGTYTPVNRLVGPLGEISTNPTYAATGAQTGVVIPDSGTATSKITIADTYNIGHVQVKLDIAHTNDPDLVVTLIAPDGTSVTLINHAGAANGANFTGTLFDDFATTPIAAGSAPFSNALGYSPESPLDAVLRNMSAKGDWKLQVTDSTGNTKTGVINSWSLTFTPNIVPVTAGDPAYDSLNTVPNRTFRIYFPDQRVSGSYSLTLNPQLRTQVTGFMLDSNHNAGLEAMRDAVVAANVSITTPTTIPTIPVIFNQNAAKAIPVKDTTVPGSEVTTSTLLITDSFDIRNLTLRLNATFTNDSKLTISLTSPDGVTVTLFDQSGNFGSRQNFSNTVFDDAATMPIQNSSAPYFGTFLPKEALADFKGHNVYGEWTLTVVNASTTDSGSINNWSLTAQKTVTNTGLGEPGADQATVNFRIFNMAAGNNSSSTQWTPVSSTNNANGYGQTTPVSAFPSGPGTQLDQNLAEYQTLAAGSITDVAVDPSDPSGNTVYVATASGGIWKTTNFLTTSASGPTYVPLTDFGPINGLNIGSVAVFGSTSSTPTNVKLTGSLISTTGSYFPAFTADKAFDGSFDTYFVGPNPDYGYVGYDFTTPRLVTSVKYAPARTYASYMVGGKFQGSLNGNTWTDLYTITSAPLDGTLTTATLSNPGYYQYVRYIGPVASYGIVSELQFYGPAANTVSAGSSNKSVVIAGTGQGSAGYAAPSASVGNNVLKSPGVGFLLSTDGGSTWNLLDSLTNVDANGNWLPIGSPDRDHAFVNTATFKVVVDPRPTQAGEVIIYAAITGGTKGGVYRSVDTGKHWTLMKAGDATDVILDYSSATVNALSNPTGNVQTIFAGFRGQGVFQSPNRGGTWNQLLGTAGGTTLVRDGSLNQNPPAIPLDPATPKADPNGAKGRIALAKPAATGNAATDALLQGWLYAVVVTADAQNFSGQLDGLYVTKDFGQNWTKIPLARIAGTTFAPTNDPTTGATFNIVDGGHIPQGEGNYSLSLTVDPNNPAVIYVGGSAYSVNGESGVVRVDTTRVFDAHSFYTPQDAADGGQLTRNIQAAVKTKDLTTLGIHNPFGSGTDSTLTGGSTFGTTPAPMYINLVGDPTNPFVRDGTYYVWNTVSWTNTGADAFWKPVDDLFSMPTYWAMPDTQRIVTTIDPLTGKTRLILANDAGVYSAVTNDDGSLNAAVGTAELVNGSRNGNLQNTQVISGAAQPDSLAAQIAGAMFYGMTTTNGAVASAWDILTSGNVTGTGNTQQGSGGTIATDQTGQTGNAYAYLTPFDAAALTDFFRVYTPGTFSRFDGLGNLGGSARTLGLITGTGTGGTTGDPQWPDRYNAVFAVNPVNGNQIAISSAQGRIFGTYNQANFWSVIGEPSLNIHRTNVQPASGSLIVGKLIYDTLDFTQANAIAYGAPDVGSDSTSDMIFVGTNGGPGTYHVTTDVLNVTSGTTTSSTADEQVNVPGHVFVTFNGGGSGGSNNWINLDPDGLDGSSVRSIITNPNRGSREVYVVTDKGVYYMADAAAPGATWTNIAGDLFAINHNPFGNVDLQETLARTLTSVAADWRYQIPNASGSGTHPVLYASGSAGVFRSVDNGATWTPFPNQSLDGAAADGGYLPNVKVTDLDLALGRINPATGMPEVNSNSPSVLLASTYGRGQFAIRVAPLVFNGAFGQDTALGERTITGLSQLNAFGNSMTYNVFDVSDPDNPVAIATGLTNTSGAQDGTFSITLPLGTTATKIAFQAVDGAGVTGPLTTLLVPPSTPDAPDLQAGSDTGTSNSDDLTKTRKPTIDDGGSLLDPGNTVTVYLNGAAVGNPVIVDSGGHWSFTFPSDLPDGIYSITITQTDVQNQTSAQSLPLQITIDGTGPAGTPKPIPSSTVNTAITNVNVASFTDAHKVVSATINWGDGSPVTVVTNPSPTNGGTFNVIASHTYTSTGNFIVSVTATDDVGNVSNAVTSQATVTPPVYAFSLTGQAFNPTENSVFNGKVAIVNDGNLSHTAANLSATINWGDGTSSVGSIVAGSAGTFNVFGTHTYLDNRQDQAAYVVTVTVNTTDGKSASVGSVADVSNVLPSGTVSDPGAIYLGQSVTLNLSASDVSPADVAAGFEYIIDWGDGTSETIARTPGNGAGITRTHTYNSVSSLITVTISDKDKARGGTRVITKPVTVKTSPTFNGSAVNGDPSRSDISQVTFNVSNTDVVGGISLSNLKLYYNGDGVNALPLAGAVLTFDPASGNGTLDLRNLATPLRDGDYQLHISVAGKLFVLSFFKLEGDINGNGVVEAKDLALINKSLGKSTGQAGFNPSADLNHDGVVNAADVARYNKLKGHKATGGTATLTLQTGKTGVIPTVNFGSVPVNTNGGYIDLVIKNTNPNMVPLKVGRLSIAGAGFNIALPGLPWGPAQADVYTQLPYLKSMTVRVYLKPSTKAQSLAGKLKFAYATSTSKDYKDVTVPVNATIVAVAAAVKGKPVKKPAKKH